MNAVCPLCDCRDLAVAFAYTAPPEGEIRFDFSAGGAYRRDVLRCPRCGHYISVHEMDMSGMYHAEYVTATYGHAEGVKRTFGKILALPPEKSDNTGRVRRILKYAEEHFAGRLSGAPRLLDVGSGLCVFPYRMKEAGWDTTALDPDRRNAEHAEQVAGVKSICADFMTAQPGSFDVITFNKVLEHVIDPVAMLRKSADHLNAGGFVYVELPDGEAAEAAGSGREEFFIDHLHVFSSASFALLAHQAGFRLQSLERLREPSTKYTLRAFLTKVPEVPA